MKRPHWNEEMFEKLEAKRESLLRLNASARSEEDELTGPEPDILDVSSNTQATGILEALTETERARVARIDAALARIDAGTYGACVECGNPIPRGRLEAIPEAAFCVACESGRESERPAS